MKNPERNTIICGDCLEIMQDWPDNCVDVVLTDPPYNVGYEYDRGSDNRRDYRGWCLKWFAELERLAGAICISPGIVNVGMWAAMRPPKWMLCWWKPGAMGRSPFGFCNWEPMLFYGTPRGKSGCDVVRAPIIPDAAVAGHPCPKPLAWATGLLSLLAKPGDLILDPFCGSGTTCVAAKREGFNYIGIDISKEYCEIARERVRETKREPYLLKRRRTSRTKRKRKGFFTKQQGKAPGKRR